ncbi:hypothetical protein [Hymenobacter latericus]|nr:hypothetical protein [Hymenobacter sp. YIM 151858-1]UYZ57837.1 hypothetical protein OIS50_12290 [Hymenobacter sp. YIM 151858-1]
MPFQRYLQAQRLSYHRIIVHHSHPFITPAMLEQVLAAKPGRS